MSKNWQDISIALAGLFQACALVERLAKTGYVPPEAYQCSIESLFQTDPPNTLAVFGELRHLETGLSILSEVLEVGNQRNRDVLRYGLGVLHLQKKLSARQDMLGVLGSRLKQASRQAEHFGPTHDNVIGNLGDLYKETLSQFRFRIHVTGDQAYLQQARIANQVRALLLAAVRSATLWRQVGGTRWQLLIRRRYLSSLVQNLLREAKLQQLKH